MRTSKRKYTRCTYRTEVPSAMQRLLNSYIVWILTSPSKRWSSYPLSCANNIRVCQVGKYRVFFLGLVLQVEVAMHLGFHAWRYPTSGEQSDD